MTVLPRSLSRRSLSLALLLALSSATSRATAQVAPETPAAEPAPETPAPSEVPSLEDRVALDAALTAISQRKLVLAQSILLRLRDQGEAAETRTAAAVILDRVNEWRRREATSLVPPLVGPTPRAAALSTNSDSTNARVPLLITTSLLGVSAWGAMVPLMFGGTEGDGNRGFIGLYMLTAASSFVAPLLITRGKHVSAGQANLAFYGGTRGLEWGLMLSNLVFGKAGGDSSDHQQAFAASLLFGSVAGLVAGATIASQYDYTPGQARTVAVLGDYGLFAGFAAAHIFGFDELGSDELENVGVVADPQFAFTRLSDSARDKRARATSAAGVVGTVAGLVGGRWLSLHRDNTWGDGEVLRASTVLGVLTGATLGVSLDLHNVNSKALLGLMLLGGTLGLVTGDSFVRDKTYTPGQAILVDLAGLAGGLGGLGITYLVDPNLSAGTYMTATTLGAAIGGVSVAYLASRTSDRTASNSNGLPAVAFVPDLSGRRLGLQMLGSF